MTPEERIVRELWPNVTLTRPELESLVSHDVAAFHLARGYTGGDVDEDAKRAALQLIQQAGYTGKNVQGRYKTIVQALIKAS